MATQIVRVSRIAVGALAATALAVGALGAGAGAATVGRSTPKPVTFTGSVVCALKGTITANPPISLNQQAVTITLKAALSSCKGNTTEHSVKITSATMTAKTALFVSCTQLSSFAIPTAKLTYTASKPGAASTALGFSGATESESNSGVISIALPGSGKSTATGSFAGPKSKAKVVFDQTFNTLATECLNGGAKTLAFSGKNGASSITVE